MFSNLAFLLTTVVVVVLVAAAPQISSAQSCPPSADLAPCTCDESTLHWECSGYEVENFNPKAIFERVSPLVGQNVIFNSLNIRWFMERELPADTMTSLKFKRISLVTNFRLETIHPDAFNETYGVTTELEISNNLLKNEDNAYDNYNFIGKFTKLESLAMGNNFDMIYIPTDPFPEPLPYLHTWKLNISVLEILGSRVFANLPNLKTAQWNHLDISVNEFASDTFEGIGPLVELDLEHNPFSRLPEDIFKPVMDGAAALRVGGVDCEFTSCWNLELDCDDVSAWLCENEALYRPKLAGFYCRRSSGFGDIWDWCRAHGRRSNY